MIVVRRKEKGGGEYSDTSLSLSLLRLFFLRSLVLALLLAVLLWSVHISLVMHKEMVI